jgi:tetratricopeptide (TPR) repeat protein
LATAYQRKELHGEAIQYYHQATNLAPDFSEAYQQMAESYQALGDGGGVAYATGMMELISGNTEEAIRQLEVAVAAKPDIANAFWGLGLAYEKTGQLGPAKSAYQQALVVDPEHILAIASLDHLENISQ